MKNFIWFETVAFVAILLMSAAVGAMRETKADEHVSAASRGARGSLVPSAASQTPQVQPRS